MFDEPNNQPGTSESMTVEKERYEMIVAHALRCIGTLNIYRDGDILSVKCFHCGWWDHWDEPEAFGD